MQQYEFFLEHYVIDDEEGSTFEFQYTQNSIYDEPSQFMVTWWGRY